MTFAIAIDLARFVLMDNANSTLIARTRDVVRALGVSAPTAQKVIRSAGGVQIGRCLFVTLPALRKVVGDDVAVRIEEVIRERGGVL